MSISEKLKNAKFTKGAIGYSTKEIDSFLLDILKAYEEEERLIKALRVKLDAYEARSAEIEKQEKDLYRMLEAARAESEKIVSASRAGAEKTMDEAKKAAADLINAARSRIAELDAQAERRYSERDRVAKTNADMIIAAADRRGRDMLAQSQIKMLEAENRALELEKHSREFEEKFRVLIAKTEHSLAELNESSVKIPKSDSNNRLRTPAPQYTEKKSEITPLIPAVTLRPRHMPLSKSETIDKTEGSSEKETGDASHTEDNTQEFAFAGGMLLSDDGNMKTVKKYNPYDTITVTYDKNSDDFGDIRKIMESAQGKKIRNPMSFME